MINKPAKGSPSPQVTKNSFLGKRTLSLSCRALYRGSRPCTMAPCEVIQAMGQSRLWSSSGVSPHFLVSETLYTCHKIMEDPTELWVSVGSSSS